ncbi:MAG: PAS domain S-box protein [Deltaproteobacteria bacterium]|nr:PAS domain S-box protein [Deltaproteobacteria bacterium]
MGGTHISSHDGPPGMPLSDSSTKNRTISTPETPPAKNLFDTGRLFEQAPIGIAIADSEFRFVRTNQALCDMLGYTEEELTQKTFRDLTHPDDMAQTLKVFERFQHGEKPVRYTKRLVRKDGTTLWAQITNSIATDEHGRFMYAYGMLENITEKKVAEEALERATAHLIRSNKELAQFAYAASHDLQEPIRLVSTYVKLLANRYYNQLDKEANEFIEFAVEGAKRLHALIQGLLEFCRSTDDHSSLILVDSNKTLSSALSNLKIQIEENRAEITHDELPVVCFHYIQLVQVFQNLVSNALKFRAESAPKIHITAGKKDKEWIFSIQDNGIGFDMSHAHRIFVIFQRLHVRHRYPGEGVGLAICQKIVEGHGGRIWVTSEQGKGATFYFSIPVSQGVG